MSLMINLCKEYLHDFTTTSLITNAWLKCRVIRKRKEYLLTLIQHCSLNNLHYYKINKYTQNKDLERNKAT